MSSTDHPLGVDVSRFQGLINFDTLAARRPAVEFIAMRATISWGYVDGWFARNFQEAKRKGLPRFAYHVIYPAEDPTRQVDHFLRTVEQAGAGEPEKGYVLDLELDHGCNAVRILDNLYNHVELIRKRKSAPVVVYSRTSWVQQYLAPAPTFKAWQNEVDWWMALYLRDERFEHPGPLALPAGMKPERVIIHQTSGGYYSTGFGVESKEIDTDRWILGREHLAGYGAATPPVPEPELTLAQRVERLENEARQKGWSV